ncbi:MAG: PepSY domain-containing protein, partial [Blastocatellia bacterium]|nr:PepSY domain-containing protein [Blastocatellia bacterium]
MNRFRKIIFWCHLPIGVTAGVVILIMSATGVLLTYEKQIIAWADMRGHRVAPPSAESARLPLETLLEIVRKARPGVAF